MRNIIISPSLMCADLLDLGREIKALEEAGADYHHIDVMDGVFVPNLQLGTANVAAIRRAASIPLDIHLMITDPENKLGWFDIREGDFVSVHYESTPRPEKALLQIKDKKAKALLAINPETSVSVCERFSGIIDGVLVMTVHPGHAGQKLVSGALEKIGEARKMFNGAVVEVDGNVSYENAKIMKEKGADMLVCGSSSVFNGIYGYKESIKKLKGAK